ncbi:leucine-rich repeat domain-containing protein [Treponema primitia]|uniref:leucine-rich repeat domain-containing protein n=1 Tax=Treponema primitia TaxID=88058 RepID=UPI0002555939|nr:leucine-rich repeat domain-containing protein [Treponema primitia]
MRRIALVCLFPLVCFFVAAQNLEDFEYDFELYDDQAEPETEMVEEPSQVSSGRSSGDFGFVIHGDRVTITAYSGDAAEIVIPAEIQGMPVTAIGYKAFADNQLIGVEIPGTVTAILYKAFENNRLAWVILGEGLTVIRDSAFANNQLGGVLIPDSVTVIGDHAFENNRITNVIFGKRIDEIGSLAFAGNRLRSVIIPDSINSLGDDVFGDTPLRYAYSGMVMHSQRALEAELGKRPLVGKFLGP